MSIIINKLNDFFLSSQNQVNTSIFLLFFLYGFIKRQKTFDTIYHKRRYKLY